jgi:hypothetical protein
MSENPLVAVEELQKQLELIKRQNIALLGDGQVFVKRTENGQIRSVKGVVALDETNGELAEIQGKIMVTSKGFYNLNQIAGLSVITPEKLTLPEGKVVVNPFPIVDPESGSISKIWVKKMAIGYSPIGNLVVTSATLLYDIKQYFIQDLVKKIKANKAAGRICMEASLSEDDKKNGIFAKIDNTMGVWADFNCMDVLKVIETYVNKKLFAERNAQSICERLALAKHPALSHAVYVAPQGPEHRRIAQVPVVGFICELTQHEMLNIADQMEQGRDIRIGDEPVEVIEVDSATATSDEMETERDIEETPPADEPNPGTVKVQPPQDSLFGGDKF